MSIFPRLACVAFASSVVLSLGLAGCSSETAPPGDNEGGGGSNEGGAGPGSKRGEGGTSNSAGGGGNGGQAPSTSSNPAATCDGDFEFGKSIFVNSENVSLGHACDDPLQPTNCFDGSFLSFPDGSCFCTIACASLKDPSIGTACSDDGAWRCRRLENKDGEIAELCTLDDANLCTAQ